MFILYITLLYKWENHSVERVHQYCSVFWWRCSAVKHSGSFSKHPSPLAIIIIVTTTIFTLQITVRLNMPLSQIYRHKKLIFSTVVNLVMYLFSKPFSLSFTRFFLENKDNNFFQLHRAIALDYTCIVFKYTFVAIVFLFLKHFFGHKVWLNSIGMTRPIYKLILFLFWCQD